MFTAILATLLDWLGTNFWKKSLWFNVSKELFNLVWKSSIILISIVLYFTWNLDFGWTTFYALLIIVILSISWIFETFIYQYVYSKEKISILTPYSNINKILTIIISFFLFWDISIESFIITLIAIIVIIAFTVDFKTLKVPRVIWLMCLAETISSALTILTWYILLKITWSSFFVISYIIWIVFLLAIVKSKSQIKELKSLPKKFYIYRLWASHLWWIWYLLSILVIKELWLSISVLLSFLWIWITLLISYILFKDRPSKKDLTLTVIVTALVWIWYLFK